MWSIWDIDHLEPRGRSSGHAEHVQNGIRAGTRYDKFSEYPREEAV